MKVQTESNTTSKDFANFGPIPILLRTTFHPTLFMYDASLDDTIANGFAYDVLCVFLGVKMELDADIAQRDAGIRERKSPYACFDDILTEANNERVSAVLLKLSGMLREGTLELGQGPGSNS